MGSTKIFGLIIGINNYPYLTEYPPLKGCVADAEEIEVYLRSTFSEPQITRLRNEDATRSNIIQAFRTLATDARIHPRDSPILIYFAGHGGQAVPPDGWPCPSGKVQMIIPYDCGGQLDGEIIHGIPDLTIAWHLKQIADKKGNNITVIFDSCFSGSGTRSLNRGTVPQSYRIRSVNYRPGPLPKTLDHLDCIPDGQLLPRGNNERGMTVAPGYVYSGQRSHILLAACKSDEYAREANKRGVFTKALLETLSRVGITNLTYKGLLERMPPLLSDQNPQCEGYEKDRIIFCTQRMTRPSGNPEPFHSKRPVLYVCASESQELRIVIEAIEKMPHQRIEIALSQTSDQPARITVISEGAKFCFYINDMEVNQYGLKRLPHTVPRDAKMTDFQRIFHGISNYEYYLRHVNETPNLEKKVLLEFFRLKPKAPQAGHEGLNSGEIDAHDLVIRGTGIDIAQDNSYYVIKLTNMTNEDLYPSLFYFDNCDYSINSLYEPPCAAPHMNADPPLKARKSMVIGYGSEGVTPFVVGIRAPYPYEVGFLKLFISTRVVDYSQIPQASPFKYSNSESRGLKLFTGKRQNDFCGNIMVPLIVRSQHNGHTRGIELSGSEHRTYPTRATAPQPQVETSVFKMVRIDGRNPFREKLHDMMKMLLHRGLHHHHHSSSELLYQQLANLNLSSESYLDKALREVQEMGERIAQLGSIALNLETKRDQSLKDLDTLTGRVNQMERWISSTAN